MLLFAAFRNGKHLISPGDRTAKFYRYRGKFQATGVFVAFPVKGITHDRVTDHFEMPPQLMAASGYQSDVDGAGAVGGRMGYHGIFGQRRFSVQW